MGQISKTRKREPGCTPRNRVVEMKRRPLPGLARWRNISRCALPVFAVDPFDARGCRKFCNHLQMDKAVIDKVICSDTNLIVLERNSQ
jgi:hypothetical protein